MYTFLHEKQKSTFYQTVLFKMCIDQYSLARNHKHLDNKTVKNASAS